MTWLKRIGKIGGALLLLPLVGIGVHYAVKHFTHAAPRGPAYGGMTVTEWIGELERPVEESGEGWGHVREYLEQPDRKTAKKVLEVMGPAAVPYLVEALDDERTSVRRSAARTLAKLGPDAHAAIPKLTELLRTDEPIRDRVAYTLKDLGEPGIDALVDALEFEASRDSALNALSLAPMIPDRGVAVILRLPEEVEVPSPVLFRALTYESVPHERAVAVAVRCLERNDRRNDAAAVLANLHAEKIEVPVERVAQVLAEVLRERDDGQAVFALGRLGTHAAPAVPELVKLVDHQAWHISSWAQQALRGVGPAVAPYEAVFLERARKSDVRARGMALSVLGTMGPEAENALYALLGALEDPVLDVRMTASQALGGRPDAADVVIPALVRAIEQPDLGGHAARALAELGKRAPAASEELQRVLTRHPEAEVRQRIVGAIMGQEHTSVYVAAVRDADEKIRRIAASRLSRHPDPQLIPLYIELLEDPATRFQAMSTLGDLGEPARIAVNRLEAMRDDVGNESKTRVRAAVAVLRVDPERANAAQALVAFIDTNDPTVRVLAVHACWRLDLLPDAVVAALRNAARGDWGSEYAVIQLIESGAANEHELLAFLDQLGRPRDPTGSQIAVDQCRDDLVQLARRGSFDPVPVLERELARLDRPLDVLLVARRAVTEIRWERLYGEGWREPTERPRRGRR